MEVLFAFLIKLTTIFVGSGIVSLLAFFIGKETSLIPKLILMFELDKKALKGECLRIQNHKKVDSESGLYEILLPDKKLIKIFSSHKSMKVV